MDEGIRVEVHEPAEGPPKFSESWMALRFVERHLGDLRYVHKWKTWMRWDGSRWLEDDTLLAYDLAHGICREAAIEMKGDGSNSSTKPIVSAKTVGAVERLARAHRDVVATTDQWDTDIWLLNTPAGVVDLRTGGIRPARPEDYMTKMTSVAPDPNCDISLWLSVVHRAMADDSEMVAYLQRMFGYALSGSTREETLHFAWGPGANSKTKITEAVRGCMGNYHKVTQMETFLASRFTRHPTEIADLQGARLVTAVETDEGRSWDEAKIKSLTGGDTQKARFMNKDFFSFKPQFTPFIHGNAKPRIKKIDEAFRRRLHMIPFTVIIPKEERDKDLGDKLQKLWPGILHWMMVGCRSRLEIGLAPPAKIEEATKAYLDSQDVISRWLEERCLLNANSDVAKTALFDSWSVWAKAANESIGKQAAFYDELEERGFTPVKAKDGTRMFRGLELNWKVSDPLGADANQRQFALANR